MPSHKSPVRSRSKCPLCGNSLYYKKAPFAFFTGKLKRVCLAPGCNFVDPGQFKMADRGYSGRTGIS